MAGLNDVVQGALQGGQPMGERSDLPNPMNPAGAFQQMTQSQSPEMTAMMSAFGRNMSSGEVSQPFQGGAGTSGPGSDDDRLARALQDWELLG